ncbi:MAG: SDR family NAD(P)-dependent oxidoreductase [Leptospiraceae bacterium]|nr:SDR family NAD(P)-dependent oxidoreductase [Leptospiraceae bacterium]
MSKRVLIVAATSDIGKHIAESFARRGYSLLLTSTNQSSLSSMINHLQTKYNVSVETYQFDITNYDSHLSFLKSILDLPEIIVCCFGYYKDQNKALSEFSEAYKTMSVNYIGAVSFLNLVSAEFKLRKSGSIVVISSVAGIRGRQMNFLYGSAKAGLTTYLSGLRNLLFKDNVSVTTILLGPVYTKMSEGHNLMPVLTAKPEVAAEKIVKAGLARKDEVYILWYWRWIMLLIQLIPEFIFKRLKPF